MASIDEIMNKIDWNMPLEIQLEGRELAKDVEDLLPFCQPVMPMRSKNVWENCALILSERDDAQLAPYLVKMFEWLQDMNWPGAYIIYDRLLNMSGDEIIKAYDYSISEAKRLEDYAWEASLLDFYKQFTQ